MEDSNAVRAIMIGASVLIAIATISAVILYYNSARQLASNVGVGTDISANYTRDIENILLKGTANGVTNNNPLTGTEVKNLLSYFYKNPEVEITVTNIAIVNPDLNATDTIGRDTSSNYININNPSSDDEMKMYNKVLKEILPGQKFTLKRTDNTISSKTGNRVMILEIDGIIV